MIKGRSTGGGDSGGIQQQYDASQLLALKVCKDDTGWMDISWGVQAVVSR
ncbi:hypothetical protein Pmar_PMAR015210 [Perkinsus marinus ATCC 50983]|uniref:Uncharacterized protein n=1 Tax=Perkinsus marinus (strain ATCC 50983 / TXsc) TaxID=423536 RepID=C5K5Q4_PERM5|nr:hypothetical protein Pmar_PMAR015210 [Perkinsus marinus ATCC 50983]EER20211.1 hypothetical protein Pmar_PMAR015210 [Perkinsus marinus ATCC 50983]|eukprot:XP_002788415.1 hypothetical protein Pmar_PMAR015210 [Perkinsus marinus ATCC 50983]